MIKVFADFTESKSAEKCRELNFGKVNFEPIPAYPADFASAGIGGTVEIQIKLDKKGNVSAILNIIGERRLREAAKKAALKTTFTPTMCDGQAVQIDALLVYSFIPGAISGDYYTPEKIEDFTDIKRDSVYYEPILNLTENYNLAFGYGDKKFHPNAPLSKGDFAHFLRLTLDLLLKRAEFASKTPDQIELFYSSNPQKIRTVEEIKDFDEKLPYAPSVSLLVSKYDIGLFTADKHFNGKNPMTYSEVLEYWAVIFGKDAVPINFRQSGRIFTRGEFALFLQESLYVLTYRVLP